MNKRFFLQLVLAILILFFITCAAAALVKGTNTGFVSTAPLTDPGGTDNAIDTISRAFKDVSPAGAIMITEIGWWCDNATEETNFDIAIYDHNAASNRPGNWISREAVNAKGTTAGWKSVPIEAAISAETTYWIAVQVDDTATITNSNYANSAGDRTSRKTTPQYLEDPWRTGVETEILYSIYAVYTTGAATCDCPANGNWEINDGSVCTLSTLCSLNAGSLHISNGSLTITATGTLNVPAGQKIIIEKTNSKLVIEKSGGKVSINK